MKVPVAEPESIEKSSSSHDSDLSTSCDSFSSFSIQLMNTSSLSSSSSSPSSSSSNLSHPMAVNSQDLSSSRKRDISLVGTTVSSSFSSTTSLDEEGQIHAQIQGEGRGQAEGHGEYSINGGDDEHQSQNWSTKTETIQRINDTCQNKNELCLYKHTLTNSPSQEDGCGNNDGINNNRGGNRDLEKIGTDGNANGNDMEDNDHHHDHAAVHVQASLTFDESDDRSYEHDLNVSEIVSETDSIHSHSETNLPDIHTDTRTHKHTAVTPIQQQQQPVEIKAEPEHSVSAPKVSLIQSDIYPTLTLTLSDQPIPIKEMRGRANSCPRSKDLEPGFGLIGLSSLTPPPSPTPHRRQISLSLSIPPRSPIQVQVPAGVAKTKNILTRRSKQARDVLKLQNAKLQTRIKEFQQLRKLKREVRRERRLERQRERMLKRQQRQRSRIIVIPSNHWMKILWDVLTVLITIVSAVQLHTYIRDRSTYEYDAFLIFTNIWFGIDLLLNFITDHRTSDGTVMRTGREVWGRYLTTWFAVDALSLLPWERMFIRPIIIMQNRRNIVTKWFFRSKGVVKVTVSPKEGRKKYSILL